MDSVARRATARPETPADCRHAREPFDALFAVIGSRKDLSPGAKLLYGKLVTMHRVGAAWTQTEIGDSLGTCRQNVWRWTRELVAADLLLVTRLGQGRANAYVLLGVAQEDLDGSASRFKPTGSGHQNVRPPAAPSGASFSRKKKGEKNREYDTKDYLERSINTTDYLETRHGRLRVPERAAEEPWCAVCASRLHWTEEHGPTRAR